MVTVVPAVPAVSTAQVDFKEGEYVFQQGDDGDGMYILSSGLAKVLKKDATDDEPREIMTLQQNMYFGERALINNEPRAASVKAVLDLTTHFISREVFEEKLVTAVPVVTV